MSGKSILVFAVITAVVVFSLGYIIDRWLNPWLIKRSVDKVLRDVKEGKPKRPRNYDFEITFDSNNVSVRSLKKSTESVPIAWEKINRATAFKRDLFSVDCICLLFETADEKVLEVNEDMKNWSELTATLPKHLPGCKPLSDWIFQVTTTAFAANPTEIFLRS